ncbi:uncharacterized protein BCR38DRAFT_204286 [Pseudomassariella vexata]|uniref:DUF1168 domain protein n=1 Tax=Pseudomassariella vexata TaxID=1141098 RepID=A0A1Y2DXI9_9PEZI|nr:uncharacterized protein BCR38DRAFT_204286 [Pseudomassariella vexata]ORY64020.1 hypothetical protein BCR38DRAFT_204286 [Pseudomassariella vexata]
MSGEGPESIPTSADPRSKRPTKKRALTPVSAQAATVEALFSRPDQEVHIPPSSSAVAKARLAAPPEIVTNVQGSSAGAGSGEFHVYKASRRREYERLRQMDEEVRKEKDSEEFEKEMEERAKRDEEKTRRNRERREKQKEEQGRMGLHRAIRGRGSWSLGEIMGKRWTQISQSRMRQVLLRRSRRASSLRKTED